MKSMDLIRQIVSGPKNRYKQDGYNLDLTYITPRVIAMAYPAEGFQKLYRNSIDEVAQLLNKKHANHYQIINVSGRQIKSQILTNIQTFYWEDHKTPQFHILFKICQIMLNHHMSSIKKVSVVHCNHGKGRTGTLICCFLLYSGLFENPDDAMRYYSKKRFQTEGYGVTQPCQIQYIRYFNELLKRPKMYPAVTSIYKIELRGQHQLKSPYFKLRYVKDDSFIFNTGDQQCQTLEVQKSQDLIIRFRDFQYFFGDVVLEIKQKQIFGKNIASNYAFHTAFIDDYAKMIEVRRSQFSPLSSVKSGIFQPSFKLRIYFKKLCDCKSTYLLAQRCESCLKYLKGDRIKQWQQIYEILDRKPKVSYEQILFGKQKGEEMEEVEKERNKTY